MNTKEYLSQIHRLDCEMENQMDEVMKLKSMATSITAPVDNERVQSSGSKDRIGSIVSKYLDMEQEINAELEYVIGKRKHIVKQIEGMEDTNHYHILYCRYVRNMTFDEVAYNMHFSLKQISRIHGKALHRFEEKYGCEYL